MTELASLPASMWILVSSAASQYFESIIYINEFNSQIANGAQTRTEQEGQDIYVRHGVILVCLVNHSGVLNDNSTLTWK